MRPVRTVCSHGDRQPAPCGDRQARALRKAVTPTAYGAGGALHVRPVDDAARDRYSETGVIRPALERMLLKVTP